jgi:hypothetical protein
VSLFPLNSLLITPTVYSNALLLSLNLRTSFHDNSAQRAAAGTEGTELSTVLRRRSVDFSSKEREMESGMLTATHVSSIFQSEKSAKQFLG